jgi:hypothetical protein
MPICKKDRPVKELFHELLIFRYKKKLEGDIQRRTSLLKATHTLLSEYKECAWIAHPLGEVFTHEGVEMTGNDLLEKISKELKIPMES